MSVVTLRPSGDGTQGGWSAVGAVNMAAAIDDDPDSNDGNTSYAQSPSVASGTMFVELDDVPADFDPDAINSITIKVAHRRLNTPNMAVDAGTVNAFLTRADETTAISTTPTAVNSPIQVDYALTSFTPSPTGTHTVAEWNGARLALVFTHTNAQAADSVNQVRVTAAEVTIDYTPAAAPEHATSGTLAGQGSTVDGLAARTREHATDGVLTAQGATVDGTASRQGAPVSHATSGVLTGDASLVDGTAARTRVHATVGTLAGPGSTLDGTAARTRAHDTDGVLAAQGAVIEGTAAREGAPQNHATTGALTGPGAAIDGAADRTRAHATDGVLAGQGSTLNGTAARVGEAVEHATSGALVGQGGYLEGTAAHGFEGITGFVPMPMPRPHRLPVSHASRGRLNGRGAKVRAMAHITRTGQNPLALLVISA